jgi:hypothetical protein
MEETEVEDNISALVFRKSPKVTNDGVIRVTAQKTSLFKFAKA